MKMGIGIYSEVLMLCIFRYTSSVLIFLVVMM